MTIDETNAGDVAVIGGSFAGLTAALYLARSRRRVMLFDLGETRNRAAADAHGFLGQDGRAPDAIRRAGLADVLAYPTVTHLADRVTAIRADGGGFRLSTAASGDFAARQVVLAYGMRDVLPPVPGLDACWGRTVIQCPYCHGYELADRPTGVLMTEPGSVDHALMLVQWTRDILLFANGHAVSGRDRADLAAKGIGVVDGVVARVEHEGRALTAVVLEDGRRVAREVLYLVTWSEPASDLAAQLGCAMTDDPGGPFVTVDEWQATSVRGVFAAGDLARPVYGAVAAAAAGAQAAHGCNHVLVART